MAEFYRFAAFISYSSKDAGFAQGLHARLEAYKVPTQLGTFDLIGDGHNNRVYPVFRDREELAAGGLDERLKAALRASANLIVICSPNSVASRWVTEEIEYFISLGRADRIFSIIAPDAEFAALDMAQLVPAPLFSDGEPPLAADARDSGDGPKNAFFKLVAGIIGINAGALQDREEKRQRNRKLALIGGFASVVIVGLLTAWAFFIPQYTYSTNYVRVVGKLTPVDEISKSIADKRKSTYRFKRSGQFGRTTLLERVNSAGSCPENSKNFVSLTGDAFEFSCNLARACGIRQLYRGEAVTGEEVLDQAGNVLERVTYRGEGEQAIREEAVVGCSRVDNGIKFVAIERGEETHNLGLDIRYRFFSAPGEPRPNDSLAYGYRVSYDQNGRQSRKTSLGAEGDAKLNKAGFAIEARNYDDAGLLKETLHLDVEGQLTDAAKTPARIEYQYTAAGNVEIMQKFQSNGSANFDDGYHAIRYTYDGSGNENSGLYLDASLSPTPIEDGVVRYELIFNEEGFATSVERFGLKDEDTLGRCQFVEIVSGPYGSNTSEFCFDRNRQPALYHDGMHERRFQYDATFNSIESRSFDRLGEPVVASNNTHRASYEWNTLGQRTSTSFWGPNGAPSIGPDKVHKFEREFDPNGYLVGERMFGPDNEPTVNRRAIHHYKYGRDKYGRKTGQSVFGIDGRALPLTIYNFATEWNELDQAVRFTTVDTQGEPMNAGSGYAVSNRTYDVRGNLSSVSFEKADGAPTRGWFGAFEVRYAYDSQDRQTEIALYDETGASMLGSAGAAYIRYTYSPVGDEIERSWYGIDGAPTNADFGPHRLTFKRDQLGRVTEARYSDTNADPVAHRQEGYFGWSNEYDNRSNIVRSVTRNAEWLPMKQKGRDYAFWQAEYDLKNRRTKIRYFDERGDPARSRDLAYGRAYEYDEFNRVSRATNLGPNGQPAPVDSVDEVYETRFYDRLGRVEERRYFRMDNTPTRLTRSIAKYRYNVAGQETWRAFFDSEENLVPATLTGRAIVEQSYDKLGNLLTEVSLGADKQPVNRVDTGWYKKEISRTPSGAIESTLCYTVQDETVPC